MLVFAGLVVYSLPSLEHCEEDGGAQKVKVNKMGRAVGVNIAAPRRNGRDGASGGKTEKRGFTCMSNHDGCPRLNC